MLSIVCLLVFKKRNASPSLPQHVIKPSFLGSLSVGKTILSAEEVKRKTYCTGNAQRPKGGEDKASY